MHAKYEVSVSNGSKVIANVKVDNRQTNKQTNKQTDRQTNRQDKNNMPPIIRSGGIKSKNNLWTPSPNNQTSTLDPTSDKSQGGVQTMPLLPMLEKEARAQFYRDKHMWRNVSMDRVLFNHFNNSGVT